MFLFFSFLFLSSDFCDHPNVAEFNDTPMTDYCDSVLNMKRLLKDINGYVVQRRLWLETTAARALPRGAPHAGLGTTPDVGVSTGEPRARAPPSDCTSLVRRGSGSCAGDSVAAGRDEPSSVSKVAGLTFFL